MSKILQLVGFKVDKEFFGVPIEKVKEIVRVPNITAVPDTPDFVEGVINLRGKIVPVVDLRTRLKVKKAERTRANRVLILEMGKNKTVGLIVDAASEILKLDDEAIEPPPELVSAVGADYVTGVGKLDDQLIVMIDLTKLLSDEDLKKAGAMQPAEVEAEEEKAAS